MTWMAKQWHTFAVYVLLIPQIDAPSALTHDKANGGHPSRRLCGVLEQEKSNVQSNQSLIEIRQVITEMQDKK